MKILRVIRSLDPCGGGPIEGLKSSIPYLNQLGISTTVACLDPPSSAFIANLPFPVIPLGPVHLGYGFRFGIVDDLRRLAPEFDSVIVEGLWQYHTLACWLAYRGTSLPYFVFVHGMLDPWFNTRYPFKFLKKSLYWRLFEHRILRDASAVFYTSLRERSLARTSFKPYQANDLCVGYGAPTPLLPTSEDLSKYYSRFPQLFGKSIFLFFGRIHPKKGVDLLVHAFSYILPLFPNSHLVLAGPVSHSYHSQLNKKISSLSLFPHVTWCGYLDAGFKRAAFSTADLFCLPSHQENFGVAVAEALSYGLPVSISDQVCISDEVLASNAGFVNPVTPSGTLKGLISWCELQAAARTQMSINASNLFTLQFEWKNSTARLAHALQSCTSIP